MPAFPFASPADRLVPAGSLGTSGTFFVGEPSPSLHEGALGPVEARDATRQGALAALGHMRAAAADAMRRARLAHTNPDLTAPARHRRASEVAAQSISPAVDTLAKAQASYAKELEGLTAKLSGPKGDFQEITLVEIRSKLSGMKPAERFMAIKRSIEKGSDLTVAALVSADSLVTTDLLSEPERAEVLNLWRKSRFPEEEARLHRLTLDTELLEKAGRILQNYQRSTYNESIVNAPVVMTEHRGSGPRPLNRGAVPSLEDRARAMSKILAG